MARPLRVHGNARCALTPALYAPLCLCQAAFAAVVIVIAGVSVAATALLPALPSPDLISHLACRSISEAPPRMLVQVLQADGHLTTYETLMVMQGAGGGSAV